jgi:hypothetical protein
MPKAQKKVFAQEAQSQTFCVSCFKPGTQTAHMMSAGTQTTSK